MGRKGKAEPVEGDEPRATAVRRPVKGSPSAGAQDDAGGRVAHPRARRDIARAKGWGGLAGFGLVLALAVSGGAPLDDALVRALAGGVIGLLVAWRSAVLVWRHLAVAEIRAARRRLEAAMAPASEEVARGEAAVVS
jgi:hypothetical protein